MSICLIGDADKEMKRWPTAFDVNVLLLVIAETRRFRNRRPTFASQAVLLKLLGLRDNTHTRRHLRDSLSFWSHASLRFTNWHVAGRDEHVTRRWAPPIRRLTLKGHSIKLELDEEWFATAQGYWASGAVAAADARWRAKPRTADDGAASGPAVLRQGADHAATRRRWLCRKIGLNHRLRNARFEPTIGKADEWLRRHRGTLQTVNCDDESPDTVNSLSVRPQSPRPPNKKAAEPRRARQTPASRKRPPTKNHLGYYEYENYEPVSEDPDGDVV